MYSYNNWMLKRYIRQIYNVVCCVCVCDDCEFVTIKVNVVQIIIKCILYIKKTLNVYI